MQACLLIYLEPSQQLHCVYRHCEASTDCQKQRCSACTEWYTSTAWASTRSFKTSRCMPWRGVSCCAVSGKPSLSCGRTPCRCLTLAVMSTSWTAVQSCLPHQLWQFSHTVLALHLKPAWTAMECPHGSMHVLATHVGNRVDVVLHDVCKRVRPVERHLNV